MYIKIIENATSTFEVSMKIDKLDTIGDWLLSTIFDEFGVAFKSGLVRIIVDDFCIIAIDNCGSQFTWSYYSMDHVGIIRNVTQGVIRESLIEMVGWFRDTYTKLPCGNYERKAEWL